MTTSEDFVNWLEGFLDACKNAPTPMQIREVRKKITALRQSQGDTYTAIWDSRLTAPTGNYSTVTLVQPDVETPFKKEQIDEDFIRAIEENKQASTLEELNS